MKSLDTHCIKEILHERQIKEKLTSHDATIMSSREIQGCELARIRSDIVDEAFLGIMKEMGMPDECTVVGVGATGRQEVLPGSDADFILYVPDNGFEEKVSGYRETIVRLLGALQIEGEPVIWIPGDFLESDYTTIASMNLDMRVVAGGTVLTESIIQERVRAICEPFFIASRHDLILQRRYGYMQQESGRTEYHVDFNIKEDRGGLRHLQHTLWLKAAIEKTNLQSMYQIIQQEDPEVYSALDLLLHIRSWVHIKKRSKDAKNIDLLDGGLWPELKLQFGDDIIQKIQTARTHIIRYGKARLKKEGIKIGDGTKYGRDGLEVDRDCKIPREDIVIQLLRNAQKADLEIASEEFDRIEKDNRIEKDDGHKQPGLNEKYSLLLQEGGKFSTTVRRLMRLNMIDRVFPFFSSLIGQNCPKIHRHAHLTRIGRVIERLENLESNIKGITKDQYDALPREFQAAIRIALTTKDIPGLAEINRNDYYGNLEQLYSNIPGAARIARFLVEKHRILFDCALMDDWGDDRELERIARQIGTPLNLDTLLIYTCAMLDYGNQEHYPKRHWDKVFSLYYTLHEHWEKNDPDKQAAYGKKMMEKTKYLSDEQKGILSQAPTTFLHSRYVAASDSLKRTIRCLEKASNENKPQITLTRTSEGTVRIIISAIYQRDLPAVVAGTCFENGLSINDAEIHAFRTESPLAVLFFEADFSRNGLTDDEQEGLVARFDKALRENIENKTLSQKDAASILEKSGATYLLEETQKTGNYKLMVKAQKDTPGFLYALTRLIAKAGVGIISTSVYTHPHDHGRSRTIEDIFILAPENIGNLKRIITPKN